MEKRAVGLTRDGKYTPLARAAFTIGLVELVRAFMPWPYSDVDRDSEEAKQQAVAIIGPAADKILDEFESIVREARREAQAERRH